MHIAAGAGEVSGIVQREEGRDADLDIRRQILNGEGWSLLALVQRHTADALAEMKAAARQRFQGRDSREARMVVFVGGHCRVRRGVKGRTIPVDDALARGDAADHLHGMTK